MSRLPINTTKYWLTAALPLALWGTVAVAHEDDDPLLTRVVFNQLEVRNADGAKPRVLEAEAWVGYDLNKLWIKVAAADRNGSTKELETQALFSRAISPYWDMQIGLRQDTKPSPSRTWGVIGLEGLAPYFFNVSTALFVGDEGRISLRVKADYDLLMTQHLILSPEIELNAFGQNDAEAGDGAGLSNVTAGLRLRYEIHREFAPYIGVSWERKFGNTANFAKAMGETKRDNQIVLGVKAWL